MRFGRRKNNEQEIQRELEAHLAAEAADQQERGLTAEEAHFAAKRQLGNLTATKEQVRQVWTWIWFERLLQDSAFALRTLRKSPGFTIFAVLALSLGLGANAAIFSVVDAVLLRSLPFRNADRLVELWEDASSVGFPEAPMAPANFVDLDRRNHVFQDMAALKGDLYALTGNGTPEQVEGSPVTANLFPLLGISPILGRNFSMEEDQSGGARVVLLSYGLWQRRFGGDRTVVGSDILLNNQAYSVVGVMPRGITFPEQSEIWVPMGLGPRELAQRDNHYLRVFARLKPGVTFASSNREMKGLALQLAREYPATNAHLGIVVVGLRDQLMGDLKVTIWAIAAGVGCVLLIACANLAGLLLTRGVGREREFALRAALGAGRGRLIGQTLVESLLLAFLGGAAGVLIALLAVPWLRLLVPVTMSAWSEPQISFSLLGFLAILSVSAAIVFGTLPAVVFSRPKLSASLQQGTRVAGSGSTRTRKILIIGEVAISVVLLIGAGLLARTFWNLANAPLGFHPEGVITLRTSLPISSDSPYKTFQARVSFYRRVLEKVARIPGVVSAGYTTFLPLTNSGGTSPFLVEGAPPLPPGEFNDANHRVVSPDYFKTMGVRLRAGRYFRDSDTETAPAVAVINEAMARQYWPNQDPLGRRFQLGQSTGEWFTVVGIVDDVRQIGLDVVGRAEMYFPYTQSAGSQGYTTPRDLAVRVNGDPTVYVRALESAIWQIDRSQPIADVMPMTQVIAGKLMARQLALELIGTFAALALLLSALGLYGLLAYTVLQRRREIGVRMALGANAGQIIGAVLGEGLSLIAMGLTVGAVGAYGVVRSMNSMLYGVATSDVWVWATSALVLIGVGWAACYLPARRASRTNPVIALRYE
jgi:putative ABC transport system permease protein